MKLIGLDLLPEINSNDPFEIGLAYFNGTKGVPIDYEQAFAWFSIADNDEHPDAPVYLAKMYIENIFVSTPTPTKKAIQCLERAVSRGRNDMYFHLVINWLKLCRVDKAEDVSHEGIRKGVPSAYLAKAHLERKLENFSTARKYYHRAYKKGMVEGAFHLGELFSEGLGCTKSEYQSKQWFLKASKLGHPEASRILRDDFCLVG